MYTHAHTHQYTQTHAHHDRMFAWGADHKLSQFWLQTHIHTHTYTNTRTPPPQVGGATLSAVLAQTKYRCAVASTGVAGGSAVATSVYPFILRGVRLLGVDSTMPQVSV